MRIEPAKKFEAMRGTAVLCRYHLKVKGKGTGQRVQAHIV